MDDKLLPITNLKEGEEAVVHSIQGKFGLTTRLAALGILPGIRVRILRNSGGPLILAVSTTRVALGRGQASKILIIKSGNEKKKG